MFFPEESVVNEIENILLLGVRQFGPFECPCIDYHQCRSISSLISLGKRLRRGHSLRNRIKDELRTLKCNGGRTFFKCCDRRTTTPTRRTPTPTRRTFFTRPTTSSQFISPTNTEVVNHSNKVSMIIVQLNKKGTFSPTMPCLNKRWS